MCYSMPDGSTLVYSKPKYFGFVTQLPKTLSVASKITFRKESIPALSVVALSTAIFISFDQPLLDGAQKFGRYIHLNSRNDYKTLVSFKLGGTRVPVYEAPRNLNSAFYSIGEGFTSLALSGGLYVYGQIKHDYRTIQTASQILQTQLAIGITTQIIKRITGRESPSRATAPGGVWRAFPSFAEFGNHTSKYDAMPSGHMTTMMGTVTVLTLNYPEKKWIKPVGYGIMALVGFAMMNNDVHWAGDYPLAIGIGYVSAQSTVRLNRWIRNEH